MWRETQPDGENRGTVLRHWNISSHASRVTSGDPSLVFAVRRMLCPVVAVVSLIVSLLACGQLFAGPYLIIGSLTFIGVIDFVEVPHAWHHERTLPALWRF